MTYIDSSFAFADVCARWAQEPLMVGFRTTDRASVPPLVELTRVATLRSLRQGGDIVPEGAIGTIVYVYELGEAFEVEFTAPVSAVILARRSDLRRA